ncbi:hypothetical protein QJS66_22185 [Kocuria rhizophila]|nr:hypothetical protein QJS66_22185 [Kocuria rhizophila]
MAALTTTAWSVGRQTQYEHRAGAQAEATWNPGPRAMMDTPRRPTSTPCTPRAGPRAVPGGGGPPGGGHPSGRSRRAAHRGR